MDDTTHMEERFGGVGERLRQEREAQGLTVADIATRTRIPTRHLAAIEANSHADLPAATYSAGFVRTYARLLGLDGHALSQQFRDELGHREPLAIRTDSYEPADPARTPSRLFAWSMLAVAVLVGVIYLYWRGTQLPDDPAALATRSAEAPVATAAAPIAQPTIGTPPAAAPPAAVAVPAPVTQPGTSALIEAQEDAWVRISEKDGAKLFQGVLAKGQQFAVPATANDPRIRTSRPTVLRITVGNTVIPPLGPPEQLVKDVSLRPEALLARSAAPQ